MIKVIIHLSVVLALVSSQPPYDARSELFIQTSEAIQHYGGGRIAYNIGILHPGYTADRRIGIVDVDGSNAMQITTAQFKFDHFDRAPHWSPNGKSVAFDSEADISPTNSGVQDTLYVLEVATGKIVGVGGRLDSFGIIKWRPDSKALAYETQLENVSPAIYKVHIVNIDGTNDHIFLDASPNVSISNPSWSPDGQHFLFYRHDYGTNAQSSQGSWVISDVDGSHQHPVAALDKAVAWYPLGITLAMDDNNGHLQLVDALSGAVEKMIDYPADKHVSDNWSPDGRYVTFAPTLDPDLHMHVVILDTTNDQVRQLDTKPGQYEYMSWSPNSRYLVVSARLDPGIASGLYILGIEDNSMVTLIPDSAEVFAPDWSKPISP